MEGDDLLQFGVNLRTVETLGVVLHQNLPVGGHRAGLQPPKPEAVQLQPLERQNLVTVFGQPVHQWRRVGSQADEEHPLPTLHRDPMEWERHAVELFLRHVRGRHQLAVQRIAPSVVRAGDRRSEATPAGVAQLRTPVPTHVVIGLWVSIPVTEHEDALSADVDHQAIAHVSEPLGATDVAPPPVEDALEVGVVDGGRPVVLPPQCGLHRRGHVSLLRNPSWPHLVPIPSDFSDL